MSEFAGVMRVAQRAGEAIIPQDINEDDNDNYHLSTFRMRYHNVIEGI